MQNKVEDILSTPTSSDMETQFSIERMLNTHEERDIHPLTHKQTQNGSVQI